ncbi:MAG: hypothetical protein UY82_C0059G0002 [Candidatus Uhrbacteria bacterium GW2011_GWC2_53_7]|uniref:SpoVT-AbrB domain-containing protein n=1 Tax=Candidatus Uhrbacteria bacterium GW2011_GWC2_53_7 TaxID=1618986 RepID=A0A0G1XUX7_9BACT|nr:MAG: hypothetical protein UY82_C0059G0002 [Candidatus Uhrbacteria bacterium GW2011_GWC2_53_7]
MAKISVDKNGQATITIPADIIKLTGWDGSTELLFIPFLQDANSGLDKSTPIVLKEVKKIKK